VTLFRPGFPTGAGHHAFTPVFPQKRGANHTILSGISTPVVKFRQFPCNFSLFICHFAILAKMIHPHHPQIHPQAGWVYFRKVLHFPHYSQLSLFLFVDKKMNPVPCFLHIGCIKRRFSRGSGRYAS